MNVNDVAERIEAIASAVDDPEMAHILEDDLYFDVLLAIASEDCENSADLAHAALAANLIDYIRWYA